MSTRRLRLLPLLLLSLAACAPSHDLANVGQVKLAARAYHDDGRYDAAFAKVAAEATSYLEQRAPRVTRPAIVFDIDDTALTTWPAIRANDFGYITEGGCDRLPKGPCNSISFEDAGTMAPLLPTLALYRRARELGVDIFFVTGRREARRMGTERNLKFAGYDSWKRVVLKPNDWPAGSTADFKSAARAAIEAEGYTIVVNIGDQQSDLDGGHAERGFKLPNPFYFIP
ncbi:MAG: acid phosphatase [Rhodospirillales bacterium]|nr:acid phosphatase [Rhodospirillales bacterium]